MYPDYDDYYEPSEEEIFFDELKERFKETLKADIRNKMESWEKENKDLREELNKYKSKERELRIKENSLKCREEDYKREVEKEFYKKTIEEVFENLLEDSDVWYAENVPHMKPKCNLCDENRELVATFPDGTTTKKPCECSKKVYSYEPVISQNRMIKFHKAYNPRYADDKNVYFVKNYRPNKNFVEAYDYYSEFKIEKIFDDFTDETKEYHKQKRYGERIAFRSQAACQKYCDWLNEKKEN